MQSLYHNENIQSRYLTTSIIVISHPNCLFMRIATRAVAEQIKLNYLCSYVMVFFGLCTIVEMRDAEG